MFSESKSVRSAFFQIAVTPPHHESVYLDSGDDIESIMLLLEIVNSLQTKRQIPVHSGMTP